MLFRSIWQAKQKCPELQLLKPHMRKYKAYSDKINTPFDRVIVTAASERVEPAWEDQLAPGGRLVVPQDVMTGGQRLLVRRKGDSGYADTWYDYCRFVPLLEGKDDRGALLGRRSFPQE